MTTITTIPYDILAIIFRNATLVPQIFDIPPYDYFSDDVVLSNGEKVDAVTKSYTTKLAITQVCRTWREAGLPYLYEALVIWSGEALNTLSKIFSLQKKYNPSHKHGGEYTRRIDMIYSTSHPKKWTVWGKELEEIFSYFPNLSIWVELSTGGVSLFGSWNIPFYSAMSKYCTKSLRYIQVLLPLMSSLGPKYESLHSFLLLIKQANYLEYFQLWSRRNQYASMMLQEAINGKHNLKALSCVGFIDGTPELKRSSDLTRLTHIIARSNQLSGNLGILKLYGNQLTSLEIVHIPIVSVGGSGEDVGLIDFASHCPWITELIMDERHLRSFLEEEDGSHFQFVVKLGLRSVKRGKWREESVQIELSALSDSKFFHKLEVVRIVDHLFSDYLKTNSDLKSFVTLWSQKLMEERGISVHDWENRPFCDMERT